MTRLTGLPSLSPAEAELRQTVLATLNGRRVEGVAMTAGIPATPPSAHDWFHCTSGAAFALLRIGGTPPPPLADDALESVRALEAGESLLREIEAALGVAIEPVRIDAALPTGVVTIAIRCGDDSMLLALPSELPLLPAPASLAPELVAAIPAPVILAIDGPRLAPHDAAALAPGDLLLLGSGPLPARLATSGISRSGRFDPDARAFLA